MGNVSWFEPVRRRWSALLRWISSRTRRAPPALTAARELSPGTAEPERPTVLHVTPEPVVHAAIVTAPVPPTPAEPAPPPVTTTPPVPATPRVVDLVPLRDVGAGALSVRIFFSRMMAATPEGLTIDFTRWQTASVERFFLAITSPGLIRRREPATTGEERLTLPTAFEGFEWD